MGQLIVDSDHHFVAGNRDPVSSRARPTYGQVATAKRISKPGGRAVRFRVRALAIKI